MYSRQAIPAGPEELVNTAQRIRARRDFEAGVYAYAIADRVLDAYRVSLVRETRTGRFCTTGMSLLVLACAHRGISIASTGVGWWEITRATDGAVGPVSIAMRSGRAGMLARLVVGGGGDVGCAGLRCVGGQNMKP